MVETMNAREMAHRIWHRARGLPTYRFYDQYRREFAEGIPADTTATALRGLLQHARKSVPYYATCVPRGSLADPFAALSRMPLLSKQTIRRESHRLLSHDLVTRKWYYNTSGGSTGEPVRLVQDAGFAACGGAIAFLYSHLAGRDFGQPEILLWGSEREILDGGQGVGAWMHRWAANTQVVNAFRMTPETMRALIANLNRRPPLRLLAYAQAAFELAAFAEREALEVRPQHAVMTSAGTLYPFMREQIERVFGCRVFNMYGSREVNCIACEIPQCDGLWVAPWGVYVEVLDDAGGSAPEGTEGEIVVTLLTNYAMPLVRYRIGDRGALAPAGTGWQGDRAQVLLRVMGRTVDAFRLPDGTIIDGEYFTHLMYYRDWVSRFQVVQRGFAQILVRVVPRASIPTGSEAEITAGIRAVMGAECRVAFDYCEDIEPSPSGKYRYTISEVG